MKKRSHRYEIYGWIQDLIVEWSDIFREILNSHSFSLLHILLEQERFMKLFDSRIWRIVLSRNSQESTSNRY